MITSIARFGTVAGLLDRLPLSLLARSAFPGDFGQSRGGGEPTDPSSVSVQPGRPGKRPNPAGSEGEILHAVARGDERALATLYDRYSSFSFALLYRILGDREEAEDALQEVFLKVWKSASRFDPKMGTVTTWLSILSRNHAVDRLRSVGRAARRAASTIDGPSAIAEPEDRSLEPPARTAIEEDAAFVRRSLDELPREQRVLIELAYFDQLSQSEIAEKLQQPLGTVKTRTRAGLQRLRRSLRSRFEAQP